MIGMGDASTGSAASTHNGGTEPVAIARMLVPTQAVTLVRPTQASTWFCSFLSGSGRTSGTSTTGTSS